MSDARKGCKSCLRFVSFDSPRRVWSNSRRGGGTLTIWLPVFHRKCLAWTWLCACKNYGCGWSWSFCGLPGALRWLDCSRWYPQTTHCRCLPLSLGQDDVQEICRSGHRGNCLQPAGRHFGGVRLRKWVFWPSRWSWFLRLAKVFVYSHGPHVPSSTVTLYVNSVSTIADWAHA